MNIKSTMKFMLLKIIKTFGQVFALGLKARLFFVIFNGCC